MQKSQKFFIINKVLHPKIKINIVIDNSVETENQFLSPEREVLLTIKEINNNPLFDPADVGKGNDIAVYVVDDSNLQVFVNSASY